MFKSCVGMLSACIALILTGCVSSGKYEKVQNDLTNAIRQKDRQEREIVQLKARIDQLTRDLIAEKGKNTEMESVRRSMEETKSKLNDKIDGLNKEIEDLQKTKNNLAKAAATLTGSLEEAKEREKTIAAQLKITQAGLESALQQKKELEKEKAALQNKLDDVIKHLGECAALAEDIGENLNTTADSLHSLQEKLNYRRETEGDASATIKVSDEAQQE